MDFAFRTGGGPSNKKGAGMGPCDGNKKAALEEYDPSHPLDSSDEDEPVRGTLSFENSNTTTKDQSNVSSISEPELSRMPRVTTTTMPVSTSEKVVVIKTKEPDVDLNSIPMPSDEYRRPTIQFSIPQRHRLMSISSLIKRQKGVMRKGQEKGGGLNFNSEVSKAFHKGDGQESADFQDGNDDDDKPKISLVHEIFGSDDEEQKEEGEESNAEVGDGNYRLPNEEDSQEDPSISHPFTENTLEENKWKKTVAEIPVTETLLEIPNNLEEPSQNVTTPPDDNEPIISIKPSSELMEAAGNESSNSPSPELITIEVEDEAECIEDFRGKENKQIVLECVSDDDDDFEVTFVGMSRANLADLRQGRLARRRDKNNASSHLKNSVSPVNGFEEGEIVESDKKKKKDKKSKKKSKKRKRSRDSRVSSKTFDRSDKTDSSEKKSLSDSDSKEVSWRKPKTAKSRNYRNGKRESEEKLGGDRSSNRKDDVSRRKSKSVSPNRFSLKSKSRRHRSISSTRHRSRSRSISRSPFSRRMNRSRGNKRFRRGGSYRSRSSGSNRSSPSHSRSRSLTKRKVRRRHSPSPVRKHRNRSSSISAPIRLSKSPKTRKRNRSIGNEVKHDKVKNKSSSPAGIHNAKTKPSKSEVPTNDDNKKKPRKDKGADDTDKEKKRKKKKREKSLSPVKAIVADGDSIVVSLSFQTPSKEEVSKPSKSSTTTANVVEQGSDKEPSSNCNNRDNCEEIDAPIANHKPTPRKGTILINLDASPSREKSEKSPDMSKSERTDLSKNPQEDKNPPEHSLDKESGIDELDFVSSSHDNSVDNTQNAFSSVSDKTSSPVEKLASASRSPYKFGEYFVSSTCDSKSSPAVVHNSPKPSKLSDTVESPAVSQKATRSSPFEIFRSNNNNSTIDSGPSFEKGKTPSPEVIHVSTNKSTSAAHVMKPMIGNIPGLFPSGFTASGNMTAPPVIIPAPPKIVPTAAPSSLFNNLVSVASALYAPLLAAKQPAQASNAGLSKHNQSGSLFSNAYGRNGTEGGDSPFSPNSSDGDDLFEPPNGEGSAADPHSGHKKPSPGESLHRSSVGSNSNSAKFGNDDTGTSKRSLFDSLFSTGPQKTSHTKTHGKQKKPSRDAKRGKHKKTSKRVENDKNGEMEMNSRLTEEVPNSAVALKINEKYLKKLNRQERVVEEVKLSLKPHYIKKHVTKEEYKEILRKTVPKVCHNKTGEINPHKIKELVEAYVKKYRKSRKVEGKST